MKKILVITPVLPKPTDLDVFIRNLAFLNPLYKVDFVDPLSFPASDVSTSILYQFWQEQFKQYILNYDAFFGFSFGGVIIQQCFPLFNHLTKKIILFSTPSFADKDLQIKLGKVIELAKKDKVEDALNSLYTDVYYPRNPPPYLFEKNTTSLIAERLIIGLNHVLATNSTAIITNSKVKYLHFIGAQSNLVNLDNVLVANEGRLVKVPQAGMRVLEDNPVFCQQIILRSLAGEE